MFMTSDIILEELFNALYTFTSTTGNNYSAVPIGYALSIFFLFFCIVIIGKRLINNGPTFVMSLLLIGSTFELLRSIILFSSEYLFCIGYTTTFEGSLYPVDIVLKLLSLLSINYAILYLAHPPKISIRYYHFSFILPFVLYYLLVIPTLLPDQLDSTLLLNTSFLASILMFTLSLSLLPFVIKAREFLNLSLVGFILFRLASSFCTIFDWLTQLEHTSILSMYANGYYIFSIPILIYYVQTVPIKNYYRVPIDAHIGGS